MIVEQMVEGGCFEAKGREEAHKSLDDRYGEAQVELCIEKCKG